MSGSHTCGQGAQTRGAGLGVGEAPAAWDVTGPGTLSSERTKEERVMGELQGPAAVGWESGRMWETLGRGHSAGKTPGPQQGLPSSKNQGERMVDVCESLCPVN